MKQPGLLKENLRAPVLYTTFFIIMFHGGYEQYFMQNIYTSRWLVSIIGIIVMYLTIPLHETKGKILFGVRTLFMIGGMVGGTIHRSPEVNLLWLLTYIIGYTATAILDSYDRQIWIYSAAISACIAGMIHLEDVIQLSSKSENILFAIAGCLPFAVALISYVTNYIKKKK